MGCRFLGTLFPVLWREIWHEEGKVTNDACESNFPIDTSWISLPVYGASCAFLDFQ